MRHESHGLGSALAPPLPSWLAPLLPFDRFTIETGDGHRVHVMTSGGDGRPVLLLHGNPTWSFLWRKVAAELAGSDLRLVMPDLVGLGLSDKPSDPSVHTLTNHARWIGDVVDALGLEQLVFVGQDWGGPIGLRLLSHRPDRLVGLVVLNTVLGPPAPGFKPTAFHRLARFPVVSTLVFRALGFPQRYLDRAQGDRRSIRGTVRRAYTWPLRGLRRNVAPLALARMVPDSAAHPSVADLVACRELVEAFAGPAAIVWGDRDPILGRLRRRTERQLPHAEVTVTQAGHFLQEEVPVEIAAAVRTVAERAGHG